MVAEKFSIHTFEKIYMLTVKAKTKGKLFGKKIASKEKQKELVSYFEKIQSKVGQLKQLQEETSRDLDTLIPSILDKAFKGEL